MAESAIIQFLEPVGRFIASLKVLIGGVFGIYIIVLYIRIREYNLLRRMYREVRKDLIMIGEKQGVELPPFRESKLKLLHEHIVDAFRKKKEAAPETKAAESKASGKARKVSKRK